DKLPFSPMHGVSSIIVLSMIRLQLSSSKPSLHLLNPFAGAFGSQAIAEGMARWVGSSRDEYAPYVTPDHIATVLQLLVLYEDVSMLHSLQITEVLKKRNVPRLEVSDVSEFVTLIETPDRVARRHPATTAQELWN